MTHTKKKGCMPYSLTIFGDMDKQTIVASTRDPPYDFFMGGKLQGRFHSENLNSVQDLKNSKKNTEF